MTLELLYSLEDAGELFLVLCEEPDLRFHHLQIFMHIVEGVLCLWLVLVHQYGVEHLQKRFEAGRSLVRIHFADDLGQVLQVKEESILTLPKVL